MKKVIVVSKTHLDLGFTDFAENIKNKYINSFIPNAISIANEVNAEKKNFVWTTGSWILCEALDHSTAKNKKLLLDAIEKGNIVPHAIPFTLHTELLDKDTIEYGLSLVKRIDKIKGSKTISAKMTDVPGHTKALVPILYSHGIRLLHIGVNGASAMPDVPECFLWKNGNAEIVVIYSGEYGGEYKNELVDDILFFDHTLDNHGASGADAVLDNIKAIGEKYPDYEVVAGTLDDYAREIWNVRDKLPVVTAEIGDSWIHGSAADPYKSGALRLLISYKNKWLKDGSLRRNSKEYRNLCNYILCLAEHTCGMDSKLINGINDYYLKEDFNSAKNSGKFIAIEQSWREQREYITFALSCLSNAHQREITPQINKLIPNELKASDGAVMKIGECCSCSNSSISINKFGGIETLVLGGQDIIKSNNNPLLSYTSYGGEDYEHWHKCYNRNMEETKHWSLDDFGRPNLIGFDDKFIQGKFFYHADNIKVVKANEIMITVDLSTDEYCSKELGAPEKAQVIYTLWRNQLSAELIWMNKSASRLTESTAIHFYPSYDTIRYQKLDSFIDPFDIVYNGNRKLAAVQKVDCDHYEIINCHSPLVSISDCNLLDWNNKFGKAEDGISFILHNNVWGTNFPLWYNDNARFKFIFKLK
ncbi:MAG: DUF5054 domain-containing protein [Clostridium sp.]|nr:DUF5054 domain-containing protein [Clostridium sp.]